MNDTKQNEDRFDREMTSGFTLGERLKFKWARALFDVLVMRVIGRAYERGIINSRQMHSIAALWKRVCFPERPASDESYDRTESPQFDFKWYARGERDPIGPVVFAVFGKATAPSSGVETEYFTAVYDDREPEEKARFAMNGPWTHFHPLAPAPDYLMSVAAERLIERAGE